MKALLALVFIALAPIAHAAPADCKVVTDANLDECSLQTYTWRDSEAFQVQVLPTPPSYLRIPTPIELGEASNGMTHVEVSVLYGHAANPDKDAPFAYAADIWYADDTTKTTSRYLVKYDANKQILQNLTLKQKQAYCDYPYFTGVPLSCRRKVVIDEPTDKYKYCAIYNQIDGPVDFTDKTQALVKELSGVNAPLLLTLRPGQEYGEMNIAVAYDTAKKEFRFQSSALEACQDQDCRGISSVSGRLVTFNDHHQYLVITASVYEDVDLKMKEYKQTWIYRSEGQNNAYCLDN